MRSMDTCGSAYTRYVRHVWEGGREGQGWEADLQTRYARHVREGGREGGREAGHFAMCYHSNSLTTTP